MELYPPSVQKRYYVGRGLTCVNCDREAHIYFYGKYMYYRETGCAMARVQRQGSPTISVILPKDSQWSCQRASDQRAFNHIVYNVPFLEACKKKKSLFERRRKKSATRLRRGREEDKAFRSTSTIQKRMKCESAIILFYYYKSRSDRDWYRYLYIYINICIYSVFRNDIDQLSHIRQIILKKIHISSIRFRDIESLINQNYTFIFILYNLPVIFL